MRLHFAAGDPSAALRAYEACRAVLEKELQTSPAPETEALAVRLRAQPLPEGPGKSSTGRASPRPSTSDIQRIQVPLVGRTPEFAQLVERYYAACQVGPQVVAIQGEAGIGKTRLATEFLGWALSQGADVLQGRAFETGGRLPYQPLVDALRPRVESENAPADLLADVWLVELNRLLPELRDRYPDLPPPPAEETTARTRLYEAVVRLGQAFAERAPMVLFVDDLQWADAASPDVLHYAVRRWTGSGTKVLALLCLRSEALAETPALVEWLAGLERDAALARIELNLLTIQDTAQLIEGLGVRSSGSERHPDATPVGFAEWLFGETGGQPFFLAETIRALLERGVLVSRRGDHGEWVLDLQIGASERATLGGFLPPSVQQVLSARLARLTLPARALISAGAVLGHGFSFERLWRVAEVPENEALPAIDELVRGHLLREVEGDSLESGTYFFSHDKVRDVAYVEAGEARRRVFHRRALDVLQTTEAAATLAHHALAAGMQDTAVRFSLQAGDDAMRLLAARDAIVHYERAMEIAERHRWSELLTGAQARRAKAFASVGLWAAARQDVEDTIGSLGADQEERRAELLVDLSEAYFWLLDIPQVHRHAAESVKLATKIGRSDLELAGTAWLGGADAADGDVQSAVEKYDRAVALARDLGVEPPAHALTFHSLTLYWLGRLDKATESSRAAVAAARKANNASLMMFTLPHLGLALASGGRYTEATQVFEEARRFGRDYGVTNLLARAIFMSTGFHVDLFDFPRAEELANEARELALSASFPPTAPSASIDLLLSFARRGEIGLAEQLVGTVAEAVEKAAGFHGWLWRLRLSEARAEIALARRDWDEALQWATDAASQSRAKARMKYEIAALRTRAQALVGLNRTNDSIEDLRGALELARTLGDPAPILHTAGTLLMIEGDEAMATEARSTLDRVVASLPDPEMRHRLEAAEPVRVVIAMA